MSKKKIIVLCGLAVLAVVLGWGYYYLSTYYEASNEALRCLENTKTYNTSIKQDSIEFTPNANSKEFGFIIYPGGKVDYRAYAPVACRIAQSGYFTIIAKMPFNLAVFNKDAATKFIRNYPNIKNWAIGGHSLGGVMASNYAQSNTDKIKGLILWASYPDKEIATSGLKVLSVYATKDGFVTMQKFQSTKIKLPKDTIFKTIEGGNHSSFGSYGLQQGDNNSLISQNEQYNQIAKYSVDFLNSLNDSLKSISH